MEWKTLILELSEFVKGIAPHLWAIAQRQVATQIVQQVLWCLGLFVAIGFLWKTILWCNRRMEEDDYSDAYIGRGFAIGAIVLCAVIFLSLLTGIVGMAINRDYYTIRVLINLIKT